MKPLVTSALLICASPSFAWEAGVEAGLCTLSHEAEGVAVRLTHDPSVPLYTITLTGTEPWPVASDFAIRFDGARPLTIRTDRHVLSADRRSLSVADRGFGNVLDGLQFNDTAEGISGETSLAVSLQAAATAVAAFRACGQVPTA